MVSQATHSVLRYDGMTGAFIDVFASGGGLSWPTYLLFRGAAPSPGLRQDGGMQPDADRNGSWHAALVAALAGPEHYSAMLPPSVPASPAARLQVAQDLDYRDPYFAVTTGEIAIDWSLAARPIGSRLENTEWNVQAEDLEWLRAQEARKAFLAEVPVSGKRFGNAAMAHEQEADRVTQ